MIVSAARNRLLKEDMERIMKEQDEAASRMLERHEKKSKLKKIIEEEASGFLPLK